MHHPTTTLCRWAAAALTAALIAGCAEEPAEVEDAERVDAAETEAPYQATIRWTSYGIPHIKADDWGGLGYGFGYAVATNGVCVLAEAFMQTRGEQSRYLGPEEERRESDIFHRAIITPERIAHANARQPAEFDAMQDGYVAGYNRYLADHEGALPQSCRDAPWVRPITREDVARLTVAVGTRYGLARAQAGIATAHPQGEDEAGADRGGESGAHGNAPGTATQVDAAEYASVAPPADAAFGSNAIALGRDATADGGGLLLGNPHFPWRGPSRFHIAHLTIPGEIDSMGTGLFTTPIVSIGFNADVAWTHTVSTALRYTLFELELAEEDPMQYRFGDELRELERREVTIEVLDDETGELREEHHHIYVSHLGPVVVDEELPWSRERAYVIADANLTNNRSGETYLRFNRASSVADMLAALRESQGVAWVNTIAADRHGDTLYADISVVPNVDRALIGRCASEHVARWRGRPTVVLRATPDCQWRNDPEAQDEGILPPDELPHLMRDDFVSNSNDSYWLTNPAEPLEGFSPIIGPERYQQSLRTRAGLHFIDEILAGEEDGRFTAEKLRDLMYSHRNYAAELLLDELLVPCEGDLGPVTLEEGEIEIGAACEVLAAWDRRHDVDSRGAQLWTELWPRVSEHEDLWRVPFDADDPVDTPRGIALEREGLRAHLREALAEAVHVLDEAGVPIDAPWGEVHFERRNDENIAIPGGPGSVGMFSNMHAELTPGEGYTPMRSGNSWIQVVRWNEDGTPDAHGILTYSQSQEPDSPHYADQTRLYSQGRWVELPFTEAEIAADPNLEVVELEGR